MSGSPGPYHYLLGYPPEFWTDEDQATGDRIAQLNPESVQGARMNRDSYRYFADQMLAAGVEAFLDLGSGVQLDGVQNRARDTPILYVDNHPQVIALLHKHVAGPPNVHILESRAQDIDTILAEAARVFGDRRKIGIFLQALLYFVEDEDVARINQALAAWSRPGSMMAVTALRPNPDHAGLQTMTEEYRNQRNLGIYLRTEDELLPLLAPWVVVPPGVRELEDIIEEMESERLTRPSRRGRIGFGVTLTLP